METVNKVELFTNLTVNEYKKARQKFNEFNSSHEGYAVILEEKEEMEENFDRINQLMKGLWNVVKNDNFDEQHKTINYLKAESYKLFKELIQFSAMLESYSLEVFQGKDRID